MRVVSRVMTMGVVYMLLLKFAIFMTVIMIVGFGR